MDRDRWGLGRRVETAARDLVALVRFFSRLPVPLFPGDAARLPDMPRAMGLVPIAGLVVALPAALAVLLLGLTALPHVIVAIVAVAVAGVATGFLHEDGLADTADGLIGGATPERRLEIMKDSRIGSFGAMALMLATLARIAALAALMDRTGVTGAVMCLLAAAAVSRAGIAVLWRALPSARPGGLADRLGRPDAGAVVLALLLAALATMLLSGPSAGIALLWGWIVAAVAVAGVAWGARRKIGGQTGDILGAAQQVAEIGFLVGLLA